jgi:hypothetical protein
MTRNWRDEFNYDRGKDWLQDLGRSGRLVGHATSPQDSPDVKEPEITTKQDGGRGPVVATILTDFEPFTTRAWITTERFDRTSH